jgi:hypothetical protein
MEGDVSRTALLYLMHGDPEAPGRDVKRISDIIRRRVAEQCSREQKRRAK